MGSQPETVKLIFIYCNGGTVNPRHRVAVELPPGQRYLIPDEVYVCDECAEAYKDKICQEIRQEQIKKTPVRHDLSDRLNLPDIFKN
jgi:hypothetical protein